ncbi:hypothetical protein B296_00056528 [Ensete ventricosum]|uniref:Uncharacterized protein n=1 Tax=Ensete ventricosum TaxID=4639 RepID=A0A426X5G6_ENSVE|nr:hypothetical protein B296_00056528 [Ensete ventricosum]
MEKVKRLSKVWSEGCSLQPSVRVGSSEAEDRFMHLPKSNAFVAEDDDTETATYVRRRSHRRSRNGVRCALTIFFSPLVPAADSIASLFSWKLAKHQKERSLFFVLLGLNGADFST